MRELRRFGLRVVTNRSPSPAIDASATGELPGVLGRETNGLPLIATGFIAVAGAAMAMLPGITSVIVFGSGSFLAVYAIVNYLEARAAPSPARRMLAGAAAMTCAAALGDLIVELARTDRTGLVVLVGLVSALAFVRFLFLSGRKRRARPSRRAA